MQALLEAVVVNRKKAASRGEAANQHPGGLIVPLDLARRFSLKTAS